MRQCPCGSRLRRRSQSPPQCPSRSGSQCERSNRVSFLIPQRSVREGVNVITLEKKRLGPLGPRADVLSLVIEPICVSAS